MNKKHLSMRWRFTLIVGLFMLMILTIVTVISMYNAKNQFAVVADFFTTQEILNAFPENPPINLEQIPDFIILDSGSTYPPVESIYSTFPIENNSDIKVAVNSAEQNYITTTLLFIGIFSTICVVTTYFLVGHMLKPLKDFKNTINTISENNFSSQLWSDKEIRKDEIGQLQLAFIEMNQRLEAAFAKQKQFSFNAAHELKTPVSVIKTGIQVLDVDQENDIQEYRDTFRILSKNIDRLSIIIDDLLCFSNNDDLPFEQIDLSLLIKSIVQEMQLIADMSRISFSLELESIALSVHPVLFHRALFNLIENAVKYNQLDGHVWIKTNQVNDAIEVCICNTGALIPSKKFDQIFEPFYRIDPSRAKTINGYGLGLSISKEIIEKHHGHITVSSHGDRNSFLIVLPYENHHNIV